MSAVFAPPPRSPSPTRRLALAGTPLLSPSSSSQSLSDLASAPSPASADEPPASGQRTAYALCFMLGFGALLPWNSVVNNLAYFIAEYSSDTISFYMSAAYTAPQLFVLAAMLAAGRAVPVRLRVLAAAATLAAVLAALPALSPIGAGVAVAAAFFMGVAAAVFQSSLYGLAGCMPPAYMQAVMAGHGAAGLTATAVAVSLQLALASTADATLSLSSLRVVAATVFGSAAAVLVACAGAFIWLAALPFTRWYEARAAAAGAGEPTPPLFADGAATPKKVAPPLPPGVEPLELQPPPPPLTTIELVRAIALPAAAVSLNFTLTFLVYPGLAPFSIDAKGNAAGGIRGLSNNTWWLILLLVNAVGDFSGRIAAGVWQAFSGRGLLAAVAARALLVVVLSGCAYGWPGFGDAVALCAILCLAATDGGYGALAMMQAPPLVPAVERERAGFAMGLFLQAGITLGSALALAYTSNVP